MPPHNRSKVVNEGLYELGFILSSLFLMIINFTLFGYYYHYIFVVINILPILLFCSFSFFDFCTCILKGKKICHVTHMLQLGVIATTVIIEKVRRFPFFHF